MGRPKLRWKDQLTLTEERNGSKGPNPDTDDDYYYTPNRLCTATFMFNYYPNNLLINDLQ
jgi:hypothetical protein